MTPYEARCLDAHERYEAQLLFKALWEAGENEFNIANLKAELQGE